MSQISLRHFFVITALALGGLALGCRREPAVPVHQGPIVLITIDALRADVVGALGGPPRLMPSLDELARQADYSGRAVSPSSWTVPSMAALFTGFQPWRAQSWSNDRAVLDERFVTLPEALKARGYRTAAFRSNHWLEAGFGYAQGFDDFRYLGQGKRAEGHLRGLQGGPDFVWIHILPPHAPYVRREPLLARLDEVPPDLPNQVRPLDLEPYQDPAVELPPEKKRVFWSLYQLNAAWADVMLGRMLAALKASGQWDRTLLVVTADHGEEFGEHGQIAHGGNLGRVLVEVPLVVKLPAGFQRRLAGEPGRRVATVRVGPTLIEAAGGVAAEGAAPSLFQTFSKGALSELYMGNGINRYSLVEGDLQLLWESRFAAPEAEYFKARYEGIGGKPEPPLSEPGKAIFDRLERSFARTLPLAGRRGDRPRLTLFRWTAEGSEPVNDPKALERLARQLKNSWLAANGSEVPPGSSKGRQPELTPEQIKEFQALGYAAGGR